MQTTELIPVDNKPRKLTFDELPELLPQQRLLLKYILEGHNYTQAYKLAGYSSDEYANRAVYCMIHRNPLKAWLDYYSQQIAQSITPEWKASKLRQIIDNALQPTIDAHAVPTYDAEIAIKAIAELNKMQGDYAASVTQVNNIHASIQDVRNAKLEYKLDK